MHTCGTFFADPVPGSLALLQPPKKDDKRGTGVPLATHRLHTVVAAHLCVRLSSVLSQFQRVTQLGEGWG